MQWKSLPLIEPCQKELIWRRSLFPYQLGPSLASKPFSSHSFLTKFSETQRSWPEFSPSGRRGSDISNREGIGDGRGPGQAHRSGRSVI